MEGDAGLASAGVGTGAGAGAGGASGQPLPARSPSGEPVEEEDEGRQVEASPTRMVASARPLQSPHPDYGTLELFVPCVCGAAMGCSLFALRLFALWGWRDLPTLVQVGGNNCSVLRGASCTTVGVATGSP